MASRPPRAPRSPKDPRHAHKRPKTQRARPPHRGEDARIAARRVKSLELRKAGKSYREIGAILQVDIATAWADVQAELLALRTLAGQMAEDVKAIELQRLDAWQAGLERNGLKKGDPRAVSAAVRISERRAKLQGLDAPVKLAGPNGGPVLERVQLYLPENGRKRREGTA